MNAAVRREGERLGRELRSRGVFASTLTLRIRFADGRIDSRTARLAEPAALDDAIVDAAQGLLARMVADTNQKGAAAVQIIPRP